MSTTLIIVELLIIGYQVLVWVVLLLNRVHPRLVPNKLMTPENMKTCAPLMATFVIATAYTIGVVGDRCLGHLSTNVRPFVIEMPLISQDSAMREFYMTEIFRPYANNYFETANRQIRLLRATFFNSFMTVIVLLVGYWPYCKKVWLLPVFLLILVLVSSGTWYLTDKSLEERLGEFQRACQENREGSTSTMEIRGVQ